jgi:hypothetical protein
MNYYKNKRKTCLYELKIGYIYYIYTEYKIYKHFIEFKFFIILLYNNIILLLSI